jgi:hypothetical protein
MYVWKYVNSKPVHIFRQQQIDEPVRGQRPRSLMLYWATTGGSPTLQSPKMVRKCID